MGFSADPTSAGARPRPTARPTPTTHKAFLAPEPPSAVCQGSHCHARARVIPSAPCTSVLTAHLQRLGHGRRYAERGLNFGMPAYPHVTCNNGPNGDMSSSTTYLTTDDAGCSCSRHSRSCACAWCSTRSVPVCSRGPVAAKKEPSNDRLFATRWVHVFRGRHGLRRRVSARGRQGPRRADRGNA